METLPSWLCHGLSSGSHIIGVTHGNSQWIQNTWSQSWLGSPCWGEKLWWKACRMSLISEFQVRTWVNWLLKQADLIHHGRPEPIRTKGQDHVYTYSFSRLLSRPLNSASFNNHFDFYHVIDKMVFSAKSMLRPRLCHATCANSNKEHGYILMDRQVLRANQNKNIIHHLNGNLCKLHADADCASNWDKIIAADDPNTAHSWPHCMLTYHDILLLWASQSQSIIASINHRGWICEVVRGSLTCQFSGFLR